MQNIESLGFQCIIAGGYPRDLIYNLPTRDIDFFILAKTENDLSYIHEEVLPIALNFKKDLGDLVYEGDPYGASFFKTISLKTVTPYPLQFIVVTARNVQALLSTFDYSINQISFNSNGVITCTDLFIETYKTKLIKVLCPIHSSSRYNYFLDKFKEFKFDASKLVKKSGSNMKKIIAPQYSVNFTPQPVYDAFWENTNTSSFPIPENIFYGPSPVPLGPYADPE